MTDVFSHGLTDSPFFVQLDSVFRVLEPVVGKIYEKAKAPGGLSRFGFGSARSEWFRVFRVCLK